MTGTVSAFLTLTLARTAVVLFHSVAPMKMALGMNGELSHWNVHCNKRTSGAGYGPESNEYPQPGCRQPQCPAKSTGRAWMTGAGW